MEQQSCFTKLKKQLCTKQWLISKVQLYDKVYFIKFKKHSCSIISTDKNKI